MIVETDIIGPAGGGEFLARHEGRIIFVTGGISGERVRVEIDNPNAKLWRGTVVEVLTASPLRVAPTCAAAAAGAGCCDWDHIDRIGAGALKRDVLLDCLTRLGHFDQQFLPDIAVSTLEPTSKWRNRARLGVDKHGRAGLRAAHSNALVIGAECNQNVAGLTANLGEAGTVQLAASSNAGRRRVRDAHPGELHIVMDDDGQRSVVHVRGRGKNRRETVLEGASTTTQQLGDVTFEVPVTGFWQAHIAAAEHYLTRIRELLSTAPGAAAWDLYGGVGVFAWGLAQLVGPEGTVVSVEAFPEAAAAGSAALSEYPVQFKTGDVEKVVAGLVRQGGAAANPALVVLDPPRSGAGAGAISAIAAAEPQEVVHIGCDPATFARDARLWADQGYELQSLEVIDAFPGTHHFETISLLKKAV